ncbi:MAG: hypothetical protein ACOY82_13645 [Pseudomonadota bacterium]
MKHRIAATTLVAWFAAAGVSAQAAPAQTAPVEPTTTEASPEQAPAPASDEDDKPYLIDPSGPIARCAIKPYQRCLKLDQAECETATREAAVLANAEIEVDAAKRSEEERSGPFFEGMAMGIFLRHMNRQTKGRFLGCMSKAR